MPSVPTVPACIWISLGPRSDAARPFGQGDTPIKEVLRLIRDNHYPIRAYLEYEYGSFRPSVEEVKACLEYCREALA